MKNKTLLIISREYLTRIQKKSFIIITILMPILLVAMIVLPVLLISLNEQKQFSRILVVDESEIFINNFEDNEHYEYSYRSGDIEQIKKEAFDQDFDVVLQILSSSQGVKSNIFYKKNLPSGLQSEVENQMDDIFFNQLLKDSLRIDPSRFEDMQQLAKSESATIQIAKQELETYYNGAQIALKLDATMPDDDGYRFDGSTLSARREAGLLYGTYALLRGDMNMETHPVYDLRLLNYLVRSAHQQGLPVLYLGGVRDDCISITDDYEVPYKSLVRHLIQDHGVRDMFYIAGLKNEDNSIRRLTYFREVLAEYDIPAFGLHVRPQPQDSRLPGLQVRSGINQADLLMCSPQ